MRRVAEKIFIIIGIMLFGLLLLGSIFFYLNIDNNPSTYDMVQQFLNDENIRNVSVKEVIGFLNIGVIYILSVSVVCVILGIVSLSFMKKNEKTKLTGKMLVITAILGTVLTLFLGVVASLAYLIAGIITLSRKPNSSIS